MIREFEGKNEKEAIENAVAELGLDQNQFEVEIMESSKSGGFLFKKNSVRIKVHFADELAEAEELPTENENEKMIIDFVTNVIEKMGYEGRVFISERTGDKVIVSIESEHSGILIGRKGKNIDALQVLVNVYENRIMKNKKQLRIILDAENYRKRREESLIKMAERTASYVCKSKSSKLLDPMNPYERRLIHTTLNQRDDVMTQSEGDGLYKRVRVIFKGSTF